MHRLRGIEGGALAVLILVLLIVAWLSVAPALFNDGDTSWHLAAGRLILDTHAVPAVDPFSQTFAGRAWTAHEWLAEVAMAGAFAAASWGGVAVLASAAIGATVLTLGLQLRRALPTPRAIAALMLVTAILAPFMLARPHVLAWPLLAGWTILLLRARDRHRAPPIVAALVIVLWANAHASFIIGLALIGVFGLDALIDDRDRRRTVIAWGSFGLAALAASLATPHGVQGLLYPFQVSGMAALPLIIEWRPTTLAQDWLFLIAVAGAAALVLTRRVRPSPVRIVLLAGLVGLAALHARHQPVAVILGTLVLSRSGAHDRSAPSRTVGAQAGATLAGLFALGLLVVAIVRVNLVMPRQDSASNPVTAIDRLPPALRARPVLNSYGFGGPLILAGVRPFIDGRGDMYGDAFMLEHQRIIDGDAAAFGRAVRRWTIGWTMLEPGSPLVQVLDRSPDWRRAYVDHWAVVHIRR